MCPCPYPYAFRSPNHRWFQKVEELARPDEKHLYANGNVWEDPQVNFGSLDLLDYPFDDFFSSLELFGGKPDSVTLYTKTPFAVSESCALDGTSDGYWNDALVSFNVFDLPRSELVSEPGTKDGERLARPRPGPGGRL